MALLLSISFAGQYQASRTLLYFPAPRTRSQYLSCITLSNTCLTVAVIIHRMLSMRAPLTAQARHSHRAAHASA